METENTQQEGFFYKVRDFVLPQCRYYTRSKAKGITFKESLTEIPGQTIFSLYNQSIGALVLFLGGYLYFDAPSGQEVTGALMGAVSVGMAQMFSKLSLEIADDTERKVQYRKNLELQLLNHSRDLEARIG